MEVLAIGVVETTTIVRVTSRSLDERSSDKVGRAINSRLRS